MSIRPNVDSRFNNAGTIEVITTTYVCPPHMDETEFLAVMAQMFEGKPQNLVRSLGTVAVQFVLVKKHIRKEKDDMFDGDDRDTVVRRHKKKV